MLGIPRSASPPSGIECPRCPHCQTRMTMTGLSPGPPAYFVRLFECGKCERIATRLVPRDPMKTGAARGWLSGELKPPE